MFFDSIETYKKCSLYICKKGLYRITVYIMNNANILIINILDDKK